MPSNAQDQIVTGERSDGHEAGRSERKLAGIAHQDVLPERHQGKNEPRNEDRAQPVAVGDERSITAAISMMRCRRDPDAAGKICESCA
jgi:hypothetical protein